MSAVVLPASVHSSAESLMTDAPRGPVRMRPARWKDVAFEHLTRLLALLVLAILAAILVALVLESRASLDKFGLAFCGTPNGTRCRSASARWCRSTAPWSPR